MVEKMELLARAPSRCEEALDVETDLKRAGHGSNRADVVCHVAVLF